MDVIENAKKRRSRLHLMARTSQLTIYYKHPTYRISNRWCYDYSSGHTSNTATL